jgi:uncharacterized protein
VTDHDGTARLFPLPNLVLFPRAVQPLHIFEPRYRQMTADALAGDRRIALVLPRPGWEKDYAGKVALHNVACLGHIDADQRLPDGRFNLLLRGLARIRLREELSHDRLYRLAAFDLLAEVPIVDADAQLHWRQTLRARGAAWFPGQGEVQDRLRELLRGPASPGTLCDLLTFMLPLDAAVKQRLLEELDDEARLRLLVRAMDGATATTSRPFPPEFSPN